MKKPQDAEDALHRCYFKFLICCAFFALFTPFMARAEPTAERQAETHALLINGGISPRKNSQSHLHHLQDMVDELRKRAIAPERIHVFSSDGEDKGNDLVVRDSLDSRLWLLSGTAAHKALAKPDLINTVWEGVTIRAATLAELRKWFARMSRDLVPGDNLLLFVTDHGSRDKKDPGNNRISLWREDLSVLEFRALLGYLQPGVRVPQVMSQCYSGGFADSMTPLNSPVPGGDVCGFYSTTVNRLAYGCYPEGRDKDRIGHAFRFIDALARNETLLAAHREVLVTDTTPDVPLRTSDVYLERVLREEAVLREVELETLVDELLGEAMYDRGRWEPEIRLLDRLGAMYGTFSPRTLAELKESVDGLQTLSDELDTYGDRWRLTRNDLISDNLDRFIEAQPKWNKRLNKKNLNALKKKGRDKLRDTLLPALDGFTRDREEVWTRLQELHSKAQDARQAEYRVDIRLAALLRMRNVLIRIAAKQLLERDGRTELATAKTAMLALEECEGSAIGAFDAASVTPMPEPEPLPPFSEELAVVERVLPSWLGIRFRSVPEKRRVELALSRGAVMVEQIYEDSHATAAGILPGDFILGPPGEPFDEPSRIREWVMLSPQDTPLPLKIVRNGEPLDVTISLGPFPTKMPQLSKPPKAGDAAPVMPALRRVSGEAANYEAIFAGRHLLFYWATWCGPCKTSVPELLAWSDATAVPVVAISDEEVSKVQGFLEKRSEPFIEHVATDDLRLSYVSYGISGTPTFVLVDEKGIVEWRQTGYVTKKGLKIEGWKWKQ